MDTIAPAHGGLQQSCTRCFQVEHSNTGRPHRSLCGGRLVQDPVNSFQTVRYASIALCVITCETPPNPVAQHVAVGDGCGGRGATRSKHAPRTCPHLGISQRIVSHSCCPLYFGEKTPQDGREEANRKAAEPRRQCPHRRPRASRLLACSWPGWWPSPTGSDPDGRLSPAGPAQCTCPAATSQHAALSPAAEANMAASGLHARRQHDVQHSH